MGRLILIFIFFTSFFGNSQESEDLVWVEGGETVIGNEVQEDAQPLFHIEVAGFWIQKYEVTNARFLEFVKLTGYLTLAERNGFSYVFNPQVDTDSINLEEAPWWHLEEGANWKHPEGRTSNLKDKEEYPVVHIAYEDASTYCKSLGMRLPTEVEREYAGQKNGEVDAKNIWQGTFPDTNLISDGFYGTAPVGSYPAGKLGLFDMQGNVWEWCWDPYHQNAYHYAKEMKPNSSQPLVPQYFDEDSPNEETRVIRGGSFLCSDQFCKGYMISGRMRSSTQKTYSHIGFRCVKEKK